MTAPDRVKQEAFREGAMQMQGKIVAWLAMKGHVDIAPKVLELTPPDYCEPVVMEVTGPGPTVPLGS